VSETASNTSHATQITGLQLEIEKLSLEQARLQRELHALLANQ
jgi:hypothetical protein